MFKAGEEDLSPGATLIPKEPLAMPALHTDPSKRKQNVRRLSVGASAGVDAAETCANANGTELIPGAPRGRREETSSLELFLSHGYKILQGSLLVPLLPCNVAFIFFHFCTVSAEAYVVRDEEPVRFATGPLVQNTQGVLWVSTIPPGVFCRMGKPRLPHQISQEVTNHLL